MKYRVLGPLEVLDAKGHSLSLGGVRQQTVLASLLLRPGQTVGLDRLVDELWERPPTSASRTVQAYVSRLRRGLPEGAIESRPGGYTFAPGGAELDLETFELRAAEGHAALTAGEYDHAASLLREALDLWRGPALAGLGSAALRREATRLEELRISVLEDRIEAELGAGRHSELVPELQALVAEHPLRERLRAQLMRALYRAGRPGDALALYREGRRLLVEELGMEPGQELRELEQAILRQDAELEVPERKKHVAPAAPELPRGTVTLLFTDIEGSTRLLHELGERYAEALAGHRRVLRDAFSRHGGVEVDMHGDATFMAFAGAASAVSAAREAQHQLAAGPVRVRMGIHTGEPLVTDDGYVGVDVHRAARIMAAAHGGQVLLSQATRAVLADELPDGLSLRDLGEYRLKDLARPHRLYQLLGEGLERDFPPPMSLERHPTNLPLQPTALVGRERELGELHALLDRPDVRLVTLTGPAGTGKTRLAVQAAAELVDEFVAGIYFVNLAALTDPRLVVPTIAQTLAIKERPGEAMLDTLAAHLAGKGMLLVLDNFEQVAEAARDVAKLLASAADIKLLVTSRARLHLLGEREYPVPPLAPVEAITLFAERARDVSPSFVLDVNRPIVAEICRRLDNLPLAIELAATRIKLLPEKALLERLDQRLQLLTAGAHDQSERHRTLRAAIQWSYDLLTSDEQRLFRRLAVFAGGRTLEAIEEVCNAERKLEVLEGVASLVDKSLLRRQETDGSQPRFVMLETIHEYAHERLEDSSEAENVRRRHAEYFVRFCEEQERMLRGRHQAFALAHFEAERDNLRAAVAWALRHDVELALHLAAAVGEFWRWRGPTKELEAWLEEALELSPTDALYRAKAFVVAGYLALVHGNIDLAEQRYNDALETSRRTGQTTETARSLKYLSSLAHWRLDLDRAQALGEQALALARREGMREELPRILDHLAMAVSRQGDAARAEALWTESLALSRELGDERLTGTTLGNLGSMLIDLGEPARGSPFLEEAIEIGRSLGETTMTAGYLANLGQATAMLGEPDRAESFLCESLELAEVEDLLPVIVFCFQGLAWTATALGELLRAAHLFAIEENLRLKTDIPRSALERKERECCLAAARAELGSADFELAWSEGERMSLDEGIAYARARVPALKPTHDSPRRGESAFGRDSAGTDRTLGSSPEGTGSTCTRSSIGPRARDLSVESGTASGGRATDDAAAVRQRLLSL
jgi:predicted ATPase/DNA-binding SARP family transcriptional activator